MAGTGRERRGGGDRGIIEGISDNLQSSTIRGMDTRRKRSRVRVRVRVFLLSDGDQKDNARGTVGFALVSSRLPERAKREKSTPLKLSRRNSLK